MNQPDPRRGSVAELTVATYVSLALGIITGPLLARALGPAGRGELATAMVASSVLMALISLGIESAVVHSLVNRLDTEQRLLGAALKYCALTFPICAVVGALAVAGPLSELSSAGRVGTFALLLTVPAELLQFCLLGILTTRGQLRSLAIMKVLPLGLLAVATVALFATGSLTVGSALTLFVLLPFVTMPVIWKLVNVHPAHPAPLVPLLKFGSRGIIGNIAGLTNARLDQLLIVPVLGAAQLGYYALAVSIAQLPLGVADALTSRAVAGMGEAPAAERPAIAARYLRLAAAASVLSCVGLAIVAPIAIPIVYGQDFRPAITPLLLLLPATILLAVRKMAATQLNVFGRPGATSIAELAGVVVTVTGLAVVLDRYGINGAALVSCVAYGTALFIDLLVLRTLSVARTFPRPRDFFEIIRDVVTRARVIARSVSHRVA